MATATQTRVLDFGRLNPEQQEELGRAYRARKQYQAASEQERAKIQECARLEADFSTFVKATWHVLRPGAVLDWSWHYDLIGEYLTLVYERKISRLIINISPRTLKSILVSVMFPVWVWTKRPEHGFMCASYAEKLSTEHSVMRRSLIESPWFQKRWGDRIWLAKDQNEKTKFKNNFQSQMIATSVGGTATGLGGNTGIIDDGMNPKQATSDAETLTAHRWLDETFRSRLDNPADDSLIIMEQRTSERDLTGHCLEADDILEKQGHKREWTHLAIPLECDDESGPETWVFPISKRVRTREVGEVLQPNRFPPAVIAGYKVRRIVWATQYQQRPSPLEGNMIKRSDVRYYGGRDPLTGDADPELPVKFDLILVSADCAFKDEKTSDYVAVSSIGVKGPDRFVLEITNKHLDLPATETEIQRHQKKFGANVVLVEDKANGSAVIKNLKRRLSGVVAIEPEGGKIVRTVAACGAWQAGNWFLDRNAGWTEHAVDQVTKFPAAKHDDVHDSLMQAEIYLQRHTYVYGLTEYVKAQEAAMAKKIKHKVATHTPANATAEDIAKLDNPTNLTKPEIDDKTERCPECSGTFFQRTTAGRRCGACGHQFDLKKPILPATTNFGEFRK